MSQKFLENVTRMIKEEGGISNRSKDADPGGLTNRGITQDTLETYIRRRIRKGDPWIHQFPTDVRDLGVGHTEVIYKEMYWDVIHGDELPDWAAAVCFDMAAHSGPAAAVRNLQITIGRVDVDGIIGPQTINRCHAVKWPNQAVNSYTQKRRAFLRSLPNAKHNPGWFPRIKRVERFALKFTVS